jgi:hypothetical protein
VLSDGSHVNFAGVLEQAIGYWRTFLADPSLEDPFA